jgi:Adenylate and Guanylate cyclase catalytic domain
MALFGYPVAQENDAERAVRAGLSIQRSLAELNRKNEGTRKPVLAARIAVDLGPVVVDATGEIFGDVPNVAARAQALAEPGSVVVTSRVQRQVAGLFVAEERGSHELKGVPEAVALYRIVRASGGGRRAGQRHLTPLVGREEELAMLLRRWERVRQGEGQLVCSPRDLEMTCSTSDVAVCCSNASRNSRLSRATSDSELSAAERRLLRVFGAFRPFDLSALRGRAPAGLWPALERLFIASTRMSAQGIVAGHNNTGHGTRAHPTLSRAAARPAHRRQTHPAASLLLSRAIWS